LPNVRRRRRRAPGIWRGIFEAPWDWRRDHGQPVATNDNGTAAGACPIKGNLSSSGRRIYHVSGGSFYHANEIDTANDERRFCIEVEAQAAGSRRSKQSCFEARPAMNLDFAGRRVLVRGNARD
jgi:hypothetical protein